MKTILVLAICAIGIASCSKRNDITPTHEPVITFSKDPSDPGERTISVSSEFGAKDVIFLKFIITAKKPVIIKHLPATLAGTLQLSNIEGPIRLLDQVGVPLGAADASSSLVDFMSADGGIKIPAGITHIGMLINVAPIGTESFHTGDYGQAGFTESNMRSIEAYDSANNRLTANDITGSVQGSKIYFSE